MEITPTMPQTKRRVIAQLLICQGCCCGVTENGHAPVPADWLRAQWRKRKLMYKVDLTIPYCLGPCDVCNVVCVLTPHGSTWLGRVDQHEQYEALLEWATQCAAAQRALPLPAQFEPHIFQRFREESGQNKGEKTP